MDNRPLAVELFAGLHGWGEGAVEAGFRVVGFDLFDMCAIFNRPRPPGIEIVLQDVLTLHGSQFRDAALIVASPPCQNYSYLAMPWSRSKDPNNSKAAKALRLKWETEGPDNRLFDACFRIQREAIEATPCVICGLPSQFHPGCTGHDFSGRYIPLIVENVRGAQPWVGRSAWNYGSFHLWGDVPALMPINLKRGRKGTKPVENRGWTAGCAITLGLENYGGIKQLHSRGDNQTAGRHRMGLGDGVKVPGQVHGAEYAFTRTGANGQTVLGTRGGTKQETAGAGDSYGGGFGWDGSAMRTGNSKSNARKMASAMIAKIPLELASHIARMYYPR